MIYCLPKRYQQTRFSAAGAAAATQRQVAAKFLGSGRTSAYFPCRLLAKLEPPDVRTGWCDIKEQTAAIEELVVLLTRLGISDLSLGQRWNDFSHESPIGLIPKTTLDRVWGHGLSVRVKADPYKAQKRPDAAGQWWRPENKKAAVAEAKAAFSG